MGDLRRSRHNDTSLASEKCLSQHDTPNDPSAGVRDKLTKSCICPSTRQELSP